MRCSGRTSGSGPGPSRSLLPLLLAAALGGCATAPLAAYVRVQPLPAVTAQQGQSPRDQAWDIKDCQAEAGYRTNYSPTDSPLGNLTQKMFFWGTAGAALGGTVDSFPATVGSSTASTGLIAGASTGGAVGAATSWGGQSRYEQAWVACMQSRGYAIELPGTPKPAGAPPRP